MPIAWDRFVTEFLEPIDRGASQAPDLDRVRQLDTPERRKAARELLDRLDGPGAGHVIDALGELMMPLAVPRLQRALKAADEGSRRRIARALWLIGGLTPALTPTEQAVVIEVARCDPHWGHRMRAVIDLRHLDEPGVDRMLYDALSDEHPLVRHHAAFSIAARCGLDTNDAEVVGLANGVMSPDEDERGAAQRRLRQIME